VGLGGPHKSQQEEQELDTERKYQLEDTSRERNADAPRTQYNVDMDME